MLEKKKDLQERVGLLIERSQTKEAIELLRKAIVDFDRGDLGNDLILISSSYQKYLKAERIGTRSSEELKVDNVQINNAILSLAKEFEAFSEGGNSKKRSNFFKRNFRLLSLLALVGIAAGSYFIALQIPIAQVVVNEKENEPTPKIKEVGPSSTTPSDEVARRNVLLMEMTSVLDKMYEELKKDAKDIPACNLSDPLIGRLDALSLQFRPNKFTDSVSNERGHFLMALARSGLKESCYQRIYESITFSYTKLQGANLRNANLQHAYLNASFFRGSDFMGANLSKATLSNVNFDEAYLDRANFTDAIGLTKDQLSKAACLYAAQGIPDSIYIPLQKEKPELFTKIR